MPVEFRFYHVYSWDTCNSILAAAILDFRLPLTSSSIETSFRWVAGPRKCGSSRCLLHAYNVILFTHITHIRVVYYVLPYYFFRWISPIKIANMTSCLLRSRDVKVMKSMLSCREFICAQSHKKVLLYIFRLKSYTAKSALVVFSPHLQHKG